MAELITSATWQDVRDALADPSIQIGMAGPPGLGKTTVAFLAGEEAGKYTAKVQFHSEFAPAEAMGFYAPGVDKKTGTQSFLWIPGPVELCYRKGGLLILDEIAEASGPMKTYLYGIMDRGPGGTISYVGRTFRQTPGYQCVATMNDWPDQGALPPALLDRFDAWFIMLKPFEMLLDLLEPDLRQICEDAYDIASKPPGDPNEPYDPMAGPDITFRMLLGFQKLRKIMPPDKAALAACYGVQSKAYTFLEILALGNEEYENEEDDGEEEEGEESDSIFDEDEDEDDDDLSDLDDGDED